MSKDSQGGLKFGKDSAKLPVKHDQHHHRKRTNDEYQLGNVKVGAPRKRNISVSSAELSVSCRKGDYSQNKTRSKEASVKKPIRGGEKKKKGGGKESKPLLHKHYYL